MPSSITPDNSIVPDVKEPEYTAPSDCPGSWTLIGNPSVSINANSTAVVEVPWNSFVSKPVGGVSYKIFTYKR